jgi:hypothetical protein
MAEKHRQLRVTADQLEHFAESFLDTLREDCAEHDQAVEAWRLTFHAGVDYLREQLRASLPPGIALDEILPRFEGSPALH